MGMKGKRTLQLRRYQHHLVFECLESRNLLAADPLAAATAAPHHDHDVVAHPGDYNQDGLVDAADYGVWRDNLGQTGPELRADGNRDNVVDAIDYDIWRNNFGFNDARPNAGVILHSGDYLPDIAANPTHTLTHHWTTTDSQSRVLIPAGATVLLSGAVAVDELRVEGTLIFDPAADVQLTATTILVGSTGSLVVRPEPGATHEIVFRDLPIDTSVDLEQITHGLIVLGEVDVAGEAKTSYLNLASSIAAGDRTIELTERPTNWAIGDRIVLPDSSPLSVHRGYDQREVRTITAIYGKVITLDRPVSFAHEGIRDYQGNVIALPPIANLSRSVKFRSENPEGIRGHTMFTEGAKVSIQYAELIELGRTRAADFLDSSVVKDGELLHEGQNQTGRYAIHLHHNETPATLIGNVIDGSPKWGIAIHSSHENVIAQNVVVDAIGAGIVTEDGNETNNHIVGNYIIGSTGSGGSLLSRGGGLTPKVVGDGTSENPFRTSSDVGHEGAGIWMHGQANSVADNIVLNSRTGITTWSRLTPDLEFPGVGLDNPRNHIFPEFSGNTIWYSIAGLVFDGVGHPEIVRIADTTVYGAAGSGIDISYSGEFDFDDLTVIGVNFPNSYGIHHQFLTGIRGRNWNIQNMGTGASFSTNFDIADSFFANISSNIANINSNAIESDAVIVGTIRNVTHARAIYSIASLWEPITAFVSHIEPRAMYVFDHNGVAGDDFQLLMREQAADFLVPSSGMSDDAITGMQTIQTAGGPVNTSHNTRLSPAGVTNGDLWATYGVALAGRVAPAAATTRDNILGLLTPIPTDTTRPGIGEIAVEYLSATSVLIKWHTDEPATSTVEYDLDQLTPYHFGRFTPANRSLKTEHAVVIRDLKPNSLYAFRPYSQDGSGNMGFVWGINFGMALPTFHTGQALVVQHLTATEMTANSARILWFTSLPVRSRLEFFVHEGDRVLYRTAIEASPPLVHSVELEGLQPGTRYGMRVLTIDENGVETIFDRQYFDTDISRTEEASVVAII
jgi:hypothetical protein